MRGYVRRHYLKTSRASGDFVNTHMKERTGVARRIAPVSVARLRCAAVTGVIGLALVFPPVANTTDRLPPLQGGVEDRSANKASAKGTAHVMPTAMIRSRHIGGHAQSRAGQPGLLFGATTPASSPLRTMRLRLGLALNVGGTTIADEEIPMKQQISLREANQHLSRYIAAVEKGAKW